MKKLAATLSMAVAATALASTVEAETWSPTGTINLAGALVVQSDITFFCILSGEATLNGSSASINQLSFTGGLCGGVFFLDLPYNIEPSSLTSVTLENVRMTGLLGNCFGDLTGTFDQLSGEITFSDAILPPSPPSTLPCRFQGVVSTSPSASYTIP